MKMWKDVVVPWANRYMWLGYLVALGIVALGGFDAYRRLNATGWTPELITGHQRNVALVRKEETAQVRAENERLREQVTAEQQQLQTERQRAETERQQHERELAAARAREAAALIAPPAPAPTPNLNTGVFVTTTPTTSVFVVSTRDDDLDTDDDPVTTYSTSHWQWRTTTSRPMVTIPLDGEIVVNGANHSCDCAREHYAPLQVVGGDYIHNCDDTVREEPRPNGLDEITSIRVVGGNYYCLCEFRHGADVRVTGGIERCL